jgi:hypothetical protein
VGLHEALGFFHQGLLVKEVAADLAVLRIFPVSGEGPDTVDHALCLFGLPRSVRQGPQALEQLMFLLPGLLTPLLEAPLAGARLEVLDVAEEDGYERGGALAPTRPRDVDLADAAQMKSSSADPDLVWMSRFKAAIEAWLRAISSATMAGSLSIGAGAPPAGATPGSSSGSDGMKSPRSRMVWSASPISGSDHPRTFRRPARLAGEARPWETSTNSLPPASFMSRGWGYSSRSKSAKHEVVIV